MLSEERSQHTSSSYDDYYASVFRLSIRHAAPVAAALYLLFFGWDLLFIKTIRQAAIVLALRVPAALIVVMLRLVEPRIRSLRALEWILGLLYVFVLLNLTAILTVIPGGLTTGIAGLMLAIMVGASMYRQRPLPVTAGGLIGVGVVFVTCHLKGLMNHEIASAVIFVTSGCIASVAFSIFLDRDLRQRHSLEVSLAKEKEQSEALLKEILPKYAIQKIHEGADTIAETISEVNIIFIDIVGFSAMSRELAPKRLVEILGEFFRCLDDLCARHGVTKIKTIGDAYMAATGAPEPSTLSAIGAVEFCLSAINSVSEISSRRETTLRVRAGIATGEVISGVLGLKRPAYDLWGETVNLASRMENTADPGTVQIDEKTFLQVNDRFVCSPRGLVEAKGFGPVNAYRISAHAAIT